MRDTPLNLSDAQVFTNPDSTGAVSDDVIDLEQDSAANVILTDDQLAGFLNVILTAVALSSGGTEGIVLEVRNADNSDGATGAEVIGAREVPLADVVAGKKFAVPFRRDIAERYVAGWLRAKSTTYTGTITIDADLADLPISDNEVLQKVTS